MLNLEDLKKISDIVDDRVTKIVNEKVPSIINTLVPPIIDERVPAIIDDKLSDFAVMVQNGFNEIHNILATKADKADITRLENKFERRIERLEDNMRVVKTKLKLS
jgi:hypothetical protein